MIKVIEITPQKMGDVKFVLKLMKRLNLSVDELGLISEIQNPDCDCPDCQIKKRKPETKNQDEVTEGLEFAKTLFNAIGKRIGEEMRDKRHEL